jgi:hypothetical protein
MTTNFVSEVTARFTVLCYHKWANSSCLATARDAPSFLTARIDAKQTSLGNARNVAIGREADVGRTAGTGRIAGVKGRPGRLGVRPKWEFLSFRQPSAPDAKRRLRKAKERDPAALRQKSEA